MQSSDSKDASTSELTMGKPRRFTLVAVSDDTVGAHPFFAMTTWPQIEQIIKDTMKEKGFESTVGAMTRESTAFNVAATGDQPVISVRSIPEKHNEDSTDLKIAILQKLAERGFRDPIEIAFESNKRGPRPVPAPIDTSRGRMTSSLSGQASPFVPSATTVPSFNLPDANTEPLPADTASAPATPFGSKPSNKSVKHLTCYYWHTTGKCRFSDDECLYSHFDTGKHAEQPRPLVPGGRAVAGKNAERVEAVVNQYRRAHSGAYPVSANELGIHQSQYSDPGQPLMAAYNYDQSPASAPAHIRTQFPLIPSSVMPYTLNKRAKSALGINQVYAEDSTTTDLSNAARRLTVGAGRPASGASGEAASTVRRPPPSSIDTHRAAAPGTWVLPTPSTASWGPYSASLSAPLSTPLTTPGASLPFSSNATYLSGSYSVAACRELCIGLDTQVNYLHELNKHLIALGYKYPTIYPQMTPMFDVIKRALQIGVDKRAGAQVLMRDEPLFGYVFGRGGGVGNMTAPPTTE